MQRFLVSVILATVSSWVILLVYLSKTSGVNVLQDLSSSFLIFLPVSLTLSLVFYFFRNLIGKLTSRGKLRFDDSGHVDMRPVWRKSYKISAIIAAIVGILAFLKLQQLLNLFNLALLLGIVIFGIFWLRR